LSHLIALICAILIFVNLTQLVVTMHNIYTRSEVRILNTIKKVQYLGVFVVRVGSVLK